MALSESTATPLTRLPRSRGGRIIRHSGRTSLEPPDLRLP